MTERGCRAPSAAPLLNTDAYVQSHTNMVIDKVVVTYTDTFDITRPRPVTTSTTQCLGSRRYLSSCLYVSVVLERKFACWCPACMHASAPSKGLVLKDQKDVCEGCVTTDLPWKETSVERTDAAGVANRKQLALVHARDLASQ